MQTKQSGMKKPKTDFRLEPSMSHRLQKPVEHFRLINRADDKYTERVRDYETGQVLHEVEEPLSQHTGHGSAKPKK